MKMAERAKNPGRFLSIFYARIWLKYIEGHMEPEKLKSDSMHNSDAVTAAMVSLMAESCVPMIIFCRRPSQRIGTHPADYAHHVSD
jgi:hypothetical protein